jgi:hypothetical protein
MAGKPSLTGVLVACIAILAAILLHADIHPNVMVTDEVGYSLMAYSLAQHGRLDVWNGFDEVQSFELLLPAMELSSNGNEFRMYGIPSPLYPFITYPFFRLEGLKGLFTLNILSYSALLVLVYLTAKLFLPEKQSLFAALAYGLMTNALPFSHYVFPHLLSTSLVALTAYLVFRNGLKDGSSTTLALAGFTGGVAVGVRFTHIVFLLVLAVYLLHSKGRRPLAHFLLGLSVPLAAISLINLYSFGSVFETGYGNPMDFIKGQFEAGLGRSSGSSNVSYIILLTPLVFCYLLARGGKLDLMRHRRLIAVAAVAIILIIGFEYLVTLASHFYSRVFDMSLEPTLTKVKYKRALLQSTPFLILSALTVLYLPKGRKKWILVSMIAMAYLNILLYSMLSQHGGADETYTMRYLMGSIPFLAILSVFSLNGLLNPLRGRELALMAIVFTLMSYVYLSDGNILYSMNRLLRTTPSMLSLLTFATAIIYHKTGGHRMLLTVLVAVSLAISFSYAYSDFKVVKWYSLALNDIQSKIAGAIADDSAVFVEKRTQATLFAPAKMGKRVRVAVSSMDDGVHTPALVDYYVKRDIPVYYLNINDLDVEWLSFFGNISTKYEQGKVEPLNARTVYDSPIVLGLQT